MGVVRRLGALVDDGAQGIRGVVRGSLAVGDAPQGVRNSSVASNGPQVGSRSKPPCQSSQHALVFDVLWSHMLVCVADLYTLELQQQVVAGVAAPTAQV